MFSRKWAQEDWFWCFWAWFWTWSSNLGFPDFRRPLERGKCRSSGKIELPASCTVLQSARAEYWALERSHVSSSSGRRAGISPIQYLYSTLERESLRSSEYLCLPVRSSGETWARAGLCFSENSENAFKCTSLHPHPILGILRPSLRHLVEVIDVEHTEALGIKLLYFPTV